MPRYFLELSYKGTNYHGWQVQPNANSIQAVLQDAMSTVLQKDITITGCGRTDTGVHARIFYAHFDHSRDDLDRDDKILYKINGILPPDIAVYGILQVREDAHARYSAVERCYEYRITRHKDPFLRDFAHSIYGPVHVNEMNKTAAMLKDYEDFTSFSKLHSDNTTNICHVKNAFWEQEDSRLVFRICADRFLRNMVRAIVGTMLEVGFGKMSTEEFRHIIEVRDRSLAGPSAPAKGLYLASIHYPPGIFLKP